MQYFFLQIYRLQILIYQLIINFETYLTGNTCVRIVNRRVITVNRRIFRNLLLFKVCNCITVLLSSTQFHSVVISCNQLYVKSTLPYDSYQVTIKELLHDCLYNLIVKEPLGYSVFNIIDLMVNFIRLYGRWSE